LIRLSSFLRLPKGLRQPEKRIPFPFLPLKSFLPPPFTFWSSQTETVEFLSCSLPISWATRPHTFTKLAPYLRERHPLVTCGCGTLGHTFFFSLLDFSTVHLILWRLFPFWRFVDKVSGPTSPFPQSRLSHLHSRDPAVVPPPGVVPPPERHLRITVRALSPEMDSVHPPSATFSAVQNEVPLIRFQPLIWPLWSGLPGVFVEIPFFFFFV